MTRALLVRKNSRVFPWLRASGFALTTFLALSAMPFYPTGAIALTSLVVGVLAFSSPALAALLIVGVAALPVMAANFVVGALFLVVGFSATQYLGADHARGFLAIVLAAVAVPLHAEWAVVVLAGYLLGPAQGMIAALIACLAIQTAGALLGLTHVGSLVTGVVGAGVLSFAQPVEDPFAFKWLATGIAEADPGAVVAAITSAQPIATLVAQPLLWGAAAMLGGVFHRRHEGRTRYATVVGVAGATVILGVASMIAISALGGSVSMANLLATGVSSILVASAVALLAETVFAIEAPASAVSTATKDVSHDIRAEDADVDELLRLIAAAEDELTSRHTSSAIVMLTDMKAFARMTEEIGSMESAKLVQRQRDLLLPIIDRHGGHGKSTGGDGLVAAFMQSSDAIAAAVDMQTALGASRKPGASEPMAIRIGIAQGEVVLDKGGRPFIGAALNLAARVMDLADGGTIIAVSDVVPAQLPDQVTAHDHGEFTLKNIQARVRVVEILWHPRQEPQTLRHL